MPLSLHMLDPLKAAKRGYAVVIQDTRGRYTSEGELLRLQGRRPRWLRHRPRPPFAAFCLCDLALAPRACGQADPAGRGATSPQPRQGKPRDHFGFRAQDG